MTKPRIQINRPEGSPLRARVLTRKGWGGFTVELEGAPLVAFEDNAQETTTRVDLKSTSDVKGSLVVHGGKFRGRSAYTSIVTFDWMPPPRTRGHVAYRKEIIRLMKHTLRFVGYRVVARTVPLREDKVTR
jgi:hypothetical protein